MYFFLFPFPVVHFSRFSQHSFHLNENVERSSFSIVTHAQLKMSNHPPLPDDFFESDSNVRVKNEYGNEDEAEVCITSGFLRNTISSDCVEGKVFHNAMFLLSGETNGWF